MMKVYRFIRFRKATATHGTNWQPSKVLEEDGIVVKFQIIGKSEVYIKLCNGEQSEVELGDIIEKETE